MICYSSHYRAELIPDPSYTIGSADNRPYDRIINPDGLGREILRRYAALRWSGLKPGRSGRLR